MKLSPKLPLNSSRLSYLKRGGYFLNSNTYFQLLVVETKGTDLASA